MFNRLLLTAGAAGLALQALVSCAGAGRTKTTKQPAAWVQPYIGTAGHGHVFLGANVPFGAVQLGPSNIIQTWDKFNGWDWCSGYNYSSREILGFTHTHLSGTGIGDLNDLLVLPANGKLQLNPMAFDKPATGYGSNFSHDSETVKPGYYQVYLDKYQVNARLTATERTGFHQYTFRKTDSAHILVDLGFGMGWDSPVKTEFRQVNDSTFLGYRFSTGWANNQQLYFAIVLDRKVTKLALFNDTVPVNAKEAIGQRVKAALYIDVASNPTVALKVGISPVSAENALLNIQQENPDWDFDKKVAAAEDRWNEELGRIKIDADEKEMTVFYTSLYHSYFSPSLFNDVNKDYRGADRQVHTGADFDNYTVFSLWDTYRAWHPLMTLAQPDRMNGFIKTMLAIYKEQGRLPLWHLHGNETNTMVGNPAIPVIVDAYLKGYRDYDVNLAWEAVKHTAMEQAEGLKYVQKLQFIPADSIKESVAKALEYAIADGAAARFAKELGKTDEYEYFNKRAHLYTQYFDRSVGFMRGRISENKWREPFDPAMALHRNNDYCEGNAWQYLWLVPQDVPGLIALLGNDKAFTDKLDQLFAASSDLHAEASPDISGMIGQYAHGNEPGHHIPYLYPYAGQPWKTAALVRQITDTFYTTQPDGLCGNEDAGQMSAWYVLSALGFYPVDPAAGIYVFGSPLVRSAVISLPGNKSFTVRVVNQSKENKYIQRVERNGNAWDKSFITHHHIMTGGSLTIHMGPKPSPTWGVALEDRPKN
ncbi:MAG: GH92 family glycosyl hydrolase [Candidatus Pseudobacter hemicellulosilyticus]|uniref:GH92 family glycosyl hydrolase n=1 Tax=Candidatus Pseudobacter hemicellulosilyticus TaxID=3121375 RepID=A0AAJ6BIG3_9BACT|nr:MAG: GH92 family glycosyl hydrolase [Pseudobacter sp.]